MNIRKLMKEKVSRVSISSKMSIVMTVSIVLILTVFLGVNRYYNSFFVYQKLENASLTYLDSIDRMMENLVSLQLVIRSLEMIPQEKQFLMILWRKKTFLMNLLKLKKKQP